MPEKPASERTEDATPERLRKARREGKVPTSQEVPSALMTGALVITLVLAGPGLFRWMFRMTSDAMAGRTLTGSIDSQGVEALMETSLLQATIALSPFLIAGSIASVLSSLLSSGWACSTKSINLKLERISPLNGLKNLVSLKSIVNVLVSLAKLAVILVIVHSCLSDRFGQILALRWAEPDGTLAVTSELCIAVLGRIALGLAAIGGIDLLYQRWNYKKDLRMTRQEVKEERKEYELSPEVKGRMRAVQFEMARKRMLQDVPKADVVLANPDHFAVALKYDAATMTAPVVIAKGPDLLAQQIKKIARDHNVPVLHRPQLTRALYRAVEVGRPVPDTLFVAVAEILALIYRMRAERRGQG